MVMMVTLALRIVALVMIVVVMMMALAFLIVMIVVVMMTLALRIVTLVLMIVVMMMMALAFLIVMIVVMVVGFLHHMLHFLMERGFLFHGGQNLRAVQLIPIGGNDYRVGILLPKQGYALCQLRLAHTGGMAEDNRTCVLHLIVEEFTEVLHVHLALLRIHHSGKAVQLNFVGMNILHGTDYIAQLAHAGGLDQDTLGRIIVNHLLQSAAEIAHQAAADTAGVHLRDLHTGLGEKCGVHTNLTEFVLNQHQFFRVVGFRDQFFYQCSLAGTEKAGKNINSCHSFHHP